jgi:acyl carrier protein
MENSNQLEQCDRIKKMIVKAVKLKISPERIENTKPLFGPEGVGLDSIDALELVVALEKEFGVRIPDSSVGRKVLVSVETIAKFIEESNSGKSKQ